ncbi:unnamed protein product, partial [Tilletia laevis]
GGEAGELGGGGGGGRHR